MVAHKFSKKQELKGITRERKYFDEIDKRNRYKEEQLRQYTTDRNTEFPHYTDFPHLIRS